MLRAIRFAVKLNMQISDRTLAPIKTLAPLLANIPAARMFEEFNKLFLSGNAVETVNMLREFDLFKFFFPATDQMLKQADEHDEINAFITLAMSNTDKRIQTNQRITPAFLLAAMLWYPLSKQITILKQQSELSAQDIFFSCLNEIMSEQQQSISIPKRFQAVMKDIWIMQDRLTSLESKKASKAFEHPKFRAGYDFLLLRAEINPAEFSKAANWWKDFQNAPQPTQQQMLKSLSIPRGQRSRNNKRRKYNKSKANSE
jgi:poly(A) polymerase